MKLLMLRGEVPTDRNPQEIVFDKLEDCDDMWTHLFFAMVHDEDEAELWYWGGEREHKFATNFTERWVPLFATYNSNFCPDIIFCRGGFPQYHDVLKRFPFAIKIYYGAGRRFLPQPGFKDYDVILQDSPEQVEMCKQAFPHALTTLFIKPAAENIFYPMPEIEKEYDVCFPANGAQTFKGHDFVYSTVPSDIKVLNLGNNPRGFKYPKNVTSYRVLRPQMAENIAKCRMGIVASKAEIDSCPRVIPEMMACGIPVVVLDRVKFWQDKYIESALGSRSPYATGEITGLDNFWKMIMFVLENLYLYDTARYYNLNLSLKIAAKFILDKAKESQT